MIMKMIIGGARIASINAVDWEDTGSGKVQATLSSGERISAFQGSFLFTLMDLMRSGDEFDFVYRAKVPKFYDNRNNDRVEYDEFVGVEIIDKPITIGGIRTGSAGEIPDELKDRTPLPRRTRVIGRAVRGANESLPIVEESLPQV